MDPSKLLEIIKAARPAARFVSPCVFVYVQVWVRVGPQNLLLIFLGPVSGERFGGIIASNFFSKGTARVSTMQLDANYETMQLVSYYHLWSLNKKIGVAKCRNGMGNGLPSC